MFIIYIFNYIFCSDALNLQVSIFIYIYIYKLYDVYYVISCVGSYSLNSRISMNINIYVSYMEIYNEQVLNLLVRRKTRDLKIRENPNTDPMFNILK